MIEKISISNLKRYGEDAQVFELAPITLLLGANSSGKSTLFQALLLLRQSWIGGLHRISRLQLQGHLVSLGRYGNVVHKHESGRQIELSLTRAGAKTTLSFSGTADSAAARLDRVHLENGGMDVNFRPYHDPTKEPGVLFLGLMDGRATLQRAGDDRSLNELIRNLEPDRDADPSEEENDASTDNHRWPSIRVRITEDTRKIEFVRGTRLTDDSNHSALTDRILGLLDATFIRAHGDIDTVSHIGPVRVPCARITEGDTRSRRVGSKGEFLGGILAGDVGLVQAVNEGLAVMRIPYKVVTEAIGKTSSAFEIFLHHLHGTGELATVSMPDVGYGMSQLLPVLVEYLRLQRKLTIDQHPDSEVLTVEQPELHLHPAWQAELASFFARKLAASRKGQSFHGRAEEPLMLSPLPQVLLETHSEHMVRRLQDHVRIGELQPEDVSLITLQPRDDGTTRVERVLLDQDGKFAVPWPGGFFPDPTLDR
jgi:energy-coupling factor transporter ATP-binding protein EcfA2